jgi:hypothetical protein
MARQVPDASAQRRRQRDDRAPRLDAKLGGLGRHPRGAVLDACDRRAKQHPVAKLVRNALRDLLRAADESAFRPRVRASDERRQRVAGSGPEERRQQRRARGCRDRPDVRRQPLVQRGLVPFGGERRLPGGFERHLAGHRHELLRGLPDRRCGPVVAWQERARRLVAHAVAPVDHPALAPAREQRDAKLCRKPDQPVLAGTDPLPAVVDEGAVGEMAGQRPAADPVASLEDEHLDPGCRQPASGGETREPGADDHHVARSGSLALHDLSPRPAGDHPPQAV